MELHNNINFVIPISEEALSEGIPTLMRILRRKIDEVSNGIKFSTQYHKMKKQFIEIKITLNTLYVKIQEMQHPVEINNLSDEEFSYLFELLKEEVVQNFTESITGTIEADEKIYQTNVMNLFKFMNISREENLKTYI